jgi:WS/DGAT/MGAT family acyltransferase
MSRPERLSALDASFLYIESRTAPSHGGFISILDGPVDFKQFRSGIAAKLPQLKRLCQSIQRVPLNLAHPSWATSTNFNLEDHVHHIQLDPTATEERAYESLLEIYYRGLDPSKPLWAFHIVNGIKGNRAAIIHMMHHCMVDGASAVILAKALYDNIPIDSQSNIREEMPSRPNAIQSLMNAAVDNVVGGTALLKRSPRSIVRVLRALKSPAFREGFAAMRSFDRAPGLRFPFNGPPSGKIDFAQDTLPLAEMRRLGAEHGGTINDVLLAIVAGGVRRYAQDCDLDVAGKYFKFQMPTNVRLPNQDGQLGNFATPVPVHVRLDIDDPVKRLHAVIECTSRVKRLKLGMGFHYAIQTIQTLLTPPGLSFVETIYGAPWLRRLEAAMNRTPGTNMFVTNLPRPQVPLYVAGRKVIKRNVLVPLLPNQRMVCGAVTYEHQLGISFTGDATLSPGVDTLMSYTMDAFDQLVRASEIAPIAEIG